MNTILHKLTTRKTPIRVVIIGVGAMGKGLFYQCSITPGIKCIALADLNISKCIEAVNMVNRKYTIVDNESELNDAVSNEDIAVTEDGMLLAACEKAEIVIEASNAIAAGARFVISALQHKKHVVLMNAEIDLLYSAYFMKVAHENGVICTSMDGDQYSVLKRIIDDFTLWGFDLVMAGNIKGFLDRYSNPAKIRPEADKRNLDYKMCTSYTDGTKLNIEMAIIANAFKMKTVVNGMLGPVVNHVSEVMSLYNFDALWADKVPFVDYVLGAEPGGGVFAVGYHEHAYQRSMLNYYKMGKGPYYLFYRPYHLCHVEAMASIVEPIFDDRPLLQPEWGFQTNVFTYAKRDLRAGEELDGLGGYNCYGMIENCSPHDNLNRLPILLAENVKLKRSIRKDEIINFDDIVYNPNDYAFDLFAKAVEASEFRSATLEPQAPTQEFRAAS